MNPTFALDDLVPHLIARCSGPPGRTAAKRWAATEPALGGINHPFDAVALCRRPCDRRRANDALGALVRLHAGDELAALAALVSLVPGLGNLAARLRRCEAVDAESLDADLACAAWEAIRAMGGTAEAWPASVILGRTRDTVRSAAAGEARRRSRQAGPAALEG